jgi:hypothetical protein
VSTGRREMHALTPGCDGQAFTLLSCMDEATPIRVTTRP